MGDDDGTAHPGLTALAFYLPQYHPIPENDEWWGRGFTEWTNTAKARPLFHGHYQPHVPADLGFYDLRCAETREAQAALARAHGLSGFIYWHYWFAGRRLLDRPLRDVLRSRQPDFPFCLAWANQSWTGTWHGAADRVLVEQTYPGHQDDEAHFAALLPAFNDDRYVKIGGKPLFYVFRPEQLPDPARFVTTWQSLSIQNGLPGLFMVAEVSDLLGAGPTYGTPIHDGFDASAYIRLPVSTTPITRTLMRMRRKLGQPEIYRYARTPVPVPSLADGSIPFPTVYPNWDNTPRCGRRGLVLHESRPELFRRHVRSALRHLDEVDGPHRILFVKSWNEWAEGNHLEPDLRDSVGYLEALRDEMRCGETRVAPAQGRQ